MFIIIVFNKVLKRSSPVSSQDSTVLSQGGNSRTVFSPKGDVTPCWGVFINLKCTSFRVLASSFRLLLLRLCSSRCAEALVVHRNSLLNRLTAV